MRGARIVFILASQLVLAESSFAQNTPVVLVHGLNADQSTWDAAASALQTQLDIQTFQPNPAWRDTYNAQGDQLQSAVGSLPPSVISVGHSNGGVVSREWSKHRNLGGLITVGTPHLGAPLAARAVDWRVPVYGFQDFFNYILDDFAQCATVQDCDWLSIIFGGGLYSGLAELGRDLARSQAELALTHGALAVAAPVLLQMVPGSDYLQDLNSSENLAREAAAVGTRVAIASIARNYDKAGWYRSFDPDHADLVAALVDVLGVLLDQAAGALDTFNDPNYFHLRSHASFWMRNLAGIVLRLDGEWCALVSGGLCTPNDTIVPLPSQRHPDIDGVAQITIQGGPVHIRETTEAVPQIAQVLVNVMSVQPRASGGGSGGNASTNVMFSNSAIRGCSGYVEWSPVYQPNADACRDYCSQNGANACEWNEGGGCYVEFGSNCYIQNGYGGWSAALISGGSPPPPPPPPASNGQMYSNAAVRGCSNYVEAAPVFEPGPDDCRAYCAANGANACEWHAPSGNCYAEWGGGCYLQSGYGDWWADLL